MDARTRGSPFRANAGARLGRRLHTIDATCAVEQLTDDAFPATAPTGDARWAQFAAGLAPALLTCAEVVVVSPHADDETLAVGGLLADLACRCVPVTIVTVTDGEASHPGVPDLAARRAAEQRAALRELGVPGGPIRLLIPDGHVAEHEAELEAALRPRCRPGTLVLAPWERDGHCDHDASGRAARIAVAGTEARLLSYFVWTWQWAAPSDLDGLDLYRRRISPRAARAKVRALDCFPSQTDDADGPPIVGPPQLVRARWPWEVLAGAGPV